MDNHIIYKYRLPIHGDVDIHLPGIRPRVLAVGLDASRQPHVWVEMEFRRGTTNIVDEHITLRMRTFHTGEEFTGYEDERYVGTIFYPPEHQYITHCYASFF